MQGQRSSVSSMPENLGFDHGSTSDASATDQHICWHHDRNSQHQMLNYMSPNDTTDAFLDFATPETENLSGWNRVNPSSSSVQSPVPQCEQIPQHEWSFKSTSADNLQLATASSSSSNPLITASGEFPLDHAHLSRKRKAPELYPGQSSGTGISNLYLPAENSIQSAIPAVQNGSSSLPNPSDDAVPAIHSEQVSPILGLSVGRVSSDSPLAVNTAGSEGYQRNLRMRLNAASNHQDSAPFNSLLTTERSLGHSSRYPPLNNPLVSSLLVTAESGSTQAQSSALPASALRRHLQISRWSRSSSSRPSRSSTSSSREERENEIHEEPNLRSLAMDVPERPVFVPAADRRNSTLSAISWGLSGENGASVGSNATSTSRNTPQHPRRLAEFVRRSLLATTDSEAEGRNGNFPPVASGSSASSLEEVSLLSDGADQGRDLQPSRSAVLLRRQLAGAFASPYSLRTLAAGSEGRSRLVSEIRNVLDLMRRGEGLRLEDVMILDQSVFYGMADIHDRHRDMRLDIDNMSYEELLALEERIGNVKTGLNEETIMKCLKQRKVDADQIDQLEEPCSICQEEYKDGEDLGALECGHDFHTGCINQWLMQKNLCPICKSTAFMT